MKVLIFGGRGMLGHKLVQSLSDVFDVKYTLSGTFDSVERFGIFDREHAIENINVLNADSIRVALGRAEPNVVINAIGIIKQVPISGDVEKTLTINSIFPHRLARLSKEFGARFISMSTDCVFNGTRGMYSEADVPDALDLYGQSKHWGEVSLENCLTLRTSIIGRELNSRNGIVEWLFSNRVQQIRGYSNAIFSGFPTIVFADIIIDIIERYRDLNGVFHVASNPINKFDLLNKINRQFDLGVQIAEKSDFAVDRSLDSTRFKEATSFEPPSWDEMIERMYADKTPYETWNDLTN